MPSGKRAKDLDSRVRDELVDSFDEELEMEIDDARLSKLSEEFLERPDPESMDRSVYFRELFRLQGELVKLQDWVINQGLKVVVIFEGRDAAGKGGVIKAHHAASQSARLPGGGLAATKRARANAMVFSALRGAPPGRRRDRFIRPQLVQSRRGRACHFARKRSARNFCGPCRNSKECWFGPASS